MGLNQYDTDIRVAQNKFTLLYCEDDTDPHELLKERELLKDSKKKAKTVKDPVAKTQRPPNPVRAATKPSALTSEDPTQKAQPTAHPVTKPEFRGRIHYRDNNNEGKENPKNGERRGGFSRVFTRGGQTQDRRVRREYNRDSGPDKTQRFQPVEKRRGEGPLVSKDENNQEIWQDILEPSSNTPATTNTDPGTTDDPNSEPSVASPPPKVEEFTLDEYRKLKSPRPKPDYNVRQPGEGEDLSRWKGMIALAKTQDAVTDGEEEEYGEFPQRVGRLKRLQIDISFKDRDRRGTTRGGRGSYRGGQTPVSQIAPPPPSILDEKDFPSLV